MTHRQRQDDELEAFRATARKYAVRLARDHMHLLDSASDPDPEDYRKAVDLYAKLGGMVPKEQAEVLLPVTWVIGASGVNLTAQALPPPDTAPTPATPDTDVVDVEPRPVPAPASTHPAAQDPIGAAVRASLTSFNFGGLEPTA